MTSLVERFTAWLSTTSVVGTLLSRQLVASIILLTLVASLEPTSAAQGTVAQDADIIIEGFVRLDAPVRLKSSAVKILIDGWNESAFVRANGYFAFRVQPGTHFLQVSATGAVFPQVKLDVSAKNRGSYTATVFVDGSIAYSTTNELIIAPLAQELYFEVKEPFNVYSLLRNPMAITVVLMLAGAFLLPWLMEGIDPEEMKEMQEQMRRQPLQTMLTGGGPSSGLPNVQATGR